MKLNKFLWSFAAIAALGLASCSTNDTPSDPNAPSQGDPTFIKVKIKTEDSRATASDYEDGATEEQAISEIHFYFYDENGKFVLKGKDVTGTESTDPRPEVTKKYERILQLDNLPGNSYPRWVVTLINTSYSPASGEDISAIKNVKLPAEKAATNKFYMSTSSHFGYVSNPYYWATPISAENFYRGSDKGTSTAVTVYIERLAAKVSITNSVTNETKNVDSRTLYKVSHPVNGDAEGEVYVELLGWGLNGLAKDNFVMKNLKDSWATTAPFNDWATSVTPSFAWRNYWAYSSVYAIDGDKTTDAQFETAQYPKNAADYANKVRDDATKGVTDTDAKTNFDAYNINYVNAKSLTNSLSTALYCMENTNQTGIISKFDYTPLTVALIHAKICDDSGNPLDMVKYHGILYQKTDFIKLVLNTIKPNAYTKTGSTYNQIDENSVELNNLYDGSVNVQLKSTVTNDELYSTEDGTTFTAFNDTKRSDINTALAGFNTNSIAIAFTEGETYYPVYIQHINYNSSHTELQEGDYGVVRNHVYKITLSQITGVGNGVYDPGEVIITPKHENDWNLDTEINILSWRIVSQDVILGQ